MAHLAFAADPDPARAAQLLSKAQTAFLAGRADEAIQLATEAIAADPQNPEGHYVRGRFHEAGAAHAKAISDYTEVLKLTPEASGVLLRRGDAHARLGQWDKALADYDQFIARVPPIRAGEAHARRAEVSARLRNWDKTIADLTVLIEATPSAESAGLYQRRGEAHFKAGHIAESIRDFDRYLGFNPDSEPHHWQRGISYYYAGEFAKGRKQFEIHQTVNQEDVENAVWHFLCIARQDGVDKARAALIPIKADRRVPMMEIHGLFAGKKTPGDVLAAVQAGNPGPGELNYRSFYAHLYLGLYYEASGKAGLAKEHITRAAKDHQLDHYMWEVANVHARRLAQ
jgi:lipoprotein NlpI